MVIETILFLVLCVVPFMLLYLVLMIDIDLRKLLVLVEAMQKLLVALQAKEKVHYKDSARHRDRIMGCFARPLSKVNHTSKDSNELGAKLDACCWNEVGMHQSYESIFFDDNISSKKKDKPWKKKIKLEENGNISRIKNDDT